MDIDFDFFVAVQIENFEDLKGFIKNRIEELELIEVVTKELLRHQRGILNALELKTKPMSSDLGPDDLPF